MTCIFGNNARYVWPAPFNRVQIRSDNPVNWTQFEGGYSMPRGKKYRAEEIIPKLREAEILISQGSTQELAAKNIGVSVQTLIRWRKEYGESVRPFYQVSASK